MIAQPEGQEASGRQDAAKTVADERAEPGRLAAAFESILDELRPAASRIGEAYDTFGYKIVLAITVFLLVVVLGRFLYYGDMGYGQRSVYIPADDGREASEGTDGADRAHVQAIVEITSLDMTNGLVIGNIRFDVTDAEDNRLTDYLLNPENEIEGSVSGFNSDEASSPLEFSVAREAQEDESECHGPCLGRRVESNRIEFEEYAYMRRVGAPFPFDQFRSGMSISITAKDPPDWLPATREPQDGVEPSFVTFDTGVDLRFSGRTLTVADDANTIEARPENFQLRLGRPRTDKFMFWISMLVFYGATGSMIFATLFSRPNHRLELLIGVASIVLAGVGFRAVMVPEGLPNRSGFDTAVFMPCLVALGLLVPIIAVGFVVDQIRQKGEGTP